MSTPQSSNVPDLNNVPTLNQNNVPDVVAPANVPDEIPATGTSDDPEIVETPVADECPSATPDMEADLLGRSNVNVS